MDQRSIDYDGLSLLLGQPLASQETPENQGEVCRVGILCGFAFVGNERS